MFSNESDQQTEEKQSEGSGRFEERNAFYFAIYILVNCFIKRAVVLALCEESYD